MFLSFDPVVAVTCLMKIPLVTPTAHNFEKWCLVFLYHLSPRTGSTYPIYFTILYSDTEQK